MKGLRPQTNVERQAEHRARVKENKGSRLSVTLSAEALRALERIRGALEVAKEPHTKKAAIEAALLAYNYLMSRVLSDPQQQ